VDGDDGTRMTTYTDIKGLAVSTSSSEALAAYERGLDLFLRWRGNPMDALAAAVKADPGFVLAHCAQALIAWRTGQVAAASSAHRAVMALAGQVRDERERAHVAVVDALQRGEREKAQALLEHTCERYPLDRLIVRVVGLNCISRGDYEGGVAIARRSLDADPGESQYMTMLGFFLEQSGFNEEGLEMSSRSLALDPTNLYTYHAVGHAYQARGDYPKALETFERAASLERHTHVLWHLAEARSLLGHERFTRDYWGSTVPALPLHERVELLWRLEMLHQASTPDVVWRDLAAEGERLLEHADALTLWTHHWIGLAFARAGQMAKAERQVAYLRRQPEGRPSGHWSTLGADILEGELAFLRGDAASAVELMATAIDRIHTMGGGSREQKDVFRDVFLDLHRRLGHPREVMALAQERLLQNPNHLQSLAALAWAYGRMGRVAERRQAWSQFVRKAEAVGLAPGAPALAEARRALHAAS
jgi:tetratricopeptide (TPR) repeat protein